MMDPVVANNRKDEDSSDSDSSEDFEGEQLARVPDLQNKVTPSEQYKAVMLEEEKDIDQAVENLPDVGAEIEELTSGINVLRDVYFGKSSYQDITPLFIDGAPFLIDASSLTASAVKESNYNGSHGGQSLHFIYICEKIIQLLSRKGGTCEVIFFKEKSKVWQDAPQLSLAENILLHHLKNNTEILTQQIDSIADPKFYQYIMEVQPNFIVLDFTFLDCLENEFDSRENLHLYNSLFSVYGLMSLSLGLYCIDINSLHLGSNSFMSFVKASDSKIAYYRDVLQKYCASISSKFSNAINGKEASESNIDKLKTKDVRRSIMVCVAKSFMNDNQFSNKSKEELARAVLVYAAVLEVLPIEARCFNHQIESADDFKKKVVDKIVRSIDIHLKSNRFEGFDYSSVADLWHGNLFVEVISSIVSMKECKNLGSSIDKVFEEYVLEFNQMTGSKLQKFPISLNESAKYIVLEKKIVTSNENLLFSKVNGDLPVINNDIFNSFCKDLSTANDVAEDSNNCNEAVLTNLRWQNTARLTGLIDRIKNDDMEAAVRASCRKYADPLRMKRMIRKKLDRQKANYAHYMDMYGSNLEGKTLERRAIVCENPTKKTQKNQKTQKKDKISKTAAKMIEDNNLKKEKKLQEEENSIYVNFKKQYKMNSNSGKSYHVNLALINHVITNMKTDLYYGKMMIYKVEVLFYLWEEECKGCKDKEKRDLSNLKELFLAIRDLMSCAQKETSLLGERERAKMGKKVCQLGFKELAQKCSLPVVEDCQGSVDVSVAESCVRFQMTHLGPELLRKIDGEIDLRVEGFIPDQWQRDMFDAIDKRQSALIVAPTSSGKTYASYYCMEKVLRESNDGKVVYVAPTKALVNQVAATVYSRFKGKAGIVYGVLTKDYRTNAFECQILVTVPECLEALFMSPEFHDWTKQLRYAIFDEVHCLTNFENGVTWERCLMMTPCPFLALSATIQNPESFHSWMQKFERYKKELDPNVGSRVVLIVHSERHNDLVKHVYETNKGLRHIHPVSHLTNRVMDAHQGIPKHIYLAPGEMIELYDVLVQVAGKDNPELKDLEPEKYFAQFESGFLFRNDAKKYEAKLRQVLEDWFINKRQLFDETVMRFRAQISDYESSNKRLAQFIASITSFVELLKNRCMLPAIVFSYDREKCEILGQYITDVYKEEEEKNAPKIKKKAIAAVDDDDDFDDRDERPLRKNKVKATSGKKEEHRRKQGEVEMNPVGLTECDIQYSVRNVVSLSMKDLQFIEARLWRKGLRKKSPAIEMFRRGVGVHHSGVPTIIRNTVEMLFRMKFLNVVFATGTLALGVHMPCKTVVILGDSPLLNTLEFHQISGRAGRRGFDKTGDVIFFGLDSKKVQSLQTSKLPKINGNYPLTVATVLRFFCLYNKIKTENEKDVEKEKRLVLNRILTVLNESLLYQAYPDLRTQMKYYFGFSCHLLVSLGLLHAESGRIHLLTNLVNLLHHHEQGILAFVYLLKIGFFHSLCKLDENHGVSETSCDTIVLIMCYLFTNIPFSNHQIAVDENEKSVDIKLPSLPSNAVKVLQSYNNIVKRSFTKYYKNVAKFNVEKFGKDEKLPISRKAFKGRCSAGDLEKDGANLESMIAKNFASNTVCSVFAGLSGQTDDDLFIENVIIGNVREEVFSNYKCIPLVELDVPLNAFAYNFYKHGIIRPIIRDHHLKPGQDYTCLLDFFSVLKHIKLSLDELQWVSEDGRDVLFGIRKTFSHIAETFRESYNRAYHEGERERD